MDEAEYAAPKAFPGGVAVCEPVDSRGAGDRSGSEGKPLHLEEVLACVGTGHRIRGRPRRSASGVVRLGGLEKKASVGLGRPRIQSLIRMGFCANADHAFRNELFSFARIDADTVEMLCTA